MYMHANVPTSYVVPTLHRESGYALLHVHHQLFFQKKAEEREHSPLSPTTAGVCFCADLVE